MQNGTCRTNAAYNTQVGEREPMYATALGKLFMSDLPENEFENYFERTTLTKLASNTMTEKDELKEAIKKIQKTVMPLTTKNS